MGTGVVRRVRALLERVAGASARGTAFEPAEAAQAAADLAELRSRLARLASLGHGEVAALSSEVEALAAALAPAFAAA